MLAPTKINTTFTSPNKPVDQTTDPANLPFIVATHPGCDKSKCCFEKHLKKSEKMYQSVLHPPRGPSDNTIHLNQTITVNNNGGDSYKKRAVILLTGVVLGAIGMKYGPGLALRGLRHIVSPLTQKMGGLTTTLAGLSAISNLNAAWNIPPRSAAQMNPSAAKPVPQESNAVNSNPTYYSIDPESGMIQE